MILYRINAVAIMEDGCLFVLPPFYLDEEDEATMIKDGGAEGIMGLTLVERANSCAHALLSVTWMAHGQEAPEGFAGFAIEATRVGEMRPGINYRVMEPHQWN